ncbi:hypothetical protein J6590_006703, partial [Homalodisca vitripennis]
LDEKKIKAVEIVTPFIRLQKVACLQQTWDNQYCSCLTPHKIVFYVYFSSSTRLYEKKIKKLEIMTPFIRLQKVACLQQTCDNQYCSCLTLHKIVFYVYFSSSTRLYEKKIKAVEIVTPFIRLQKVACLQQTCDNQYCSCLTPHKIVFYVYFSSSTRLYEKKIKKVEIMTPFIRLQKVACLQQTCDNQYCSCLTPHKIVFYVYFSSSTRLYEKKIKAVEIVTPFIRLQKVACLQQTCDNQYCSCLTPHKIVFYVYFSSSTRLYEKKIKDVEIMTPFIRLQKVACLQQTCDNQYCSCLTPHKIVFYVYFSSCIRLYEKKIKDVEIMTPFIRLQKVACLRQTCDNQYCSCLT